MADTNGAAIARVDRAGLLVSADDPIDSLQKAAGSALGQPLAVPQLAALARSAQSLMVALSKPVIAADEARDLELWVRADPDAEGVTLTIERVTEHSPAPARLDRTLRIDLEGDEDIATAAVPLDWSVDANLAVSDLSDGLAAMLEIEEWAGVPLTRLFRLLENEDGTLPLLAALAAREDFAGQAVEPRRGGDTLHLSGTAQLSADGRFAGFKGTARRAAEPVAEDETAVMIDEAIDSAMRSPLDLIIDAADRIVDRSEGPLRSDYASYAGDIAAAGRHLLEVIRSMSDTAATDVGAVDAMEAVSEATALVRPAAANRAISIEIDRPDARISVRGERRAIVQVIVNILGNAIRHSPDDGTVAVVFETSGDKAAITIADQGAGIPLADQARIFERYEQSGPPDKAAQGTGLGLAISRRLARSMGGEIAIVSAPGEGARFTLTLDRA